MSHQGRPHPNPLTGGLICVELGWLIVSLVKSRHGDRELLQYVHLARVPIAGEQLVLGPDHGHVEDVAQVSHYDGGQVTVTITPAYVRDPEQLDELMKIARDDGWQILGGNPL